MPACAPVGAAVGIARLWPVSWVPVVLTRRMVFVTSGVALASACGSPAESGSSPASVPSVPSAVTDAVRDRALAAEADLIARYDAALALPTVAADGPLTAKLSAIRAEHGSHAAAIKDGYQAGTSPTTASGSATAGSAATSSATATPATPTSTPTTAPPDAKSTVAALIKAEQDASAARTADILAADGATAMLLASVAAAESGHAALLLGGAA